jgi:hypothetical protein
MATTTKPMKPEAAPPTLAEATAALERARTEVARLQQLCTGTVTRWVTRTTQMNYLTPMGPHGTLEQAEITEPVREARDVPALERMQAKRQLPDAELAVAFAEEALEAAQAAARETERQQRVAVLAEGQQLLEREWRPLVAEQRRVQRKWQTLAGRLEGIDHRLGGQLRFRSAAWPAMDANGAFDFFVRATADGFRLALDE